MHVRETESEQVACIDSHECLLVQSRVAVDDIPEHARRRERQTHVCEAKAEDWPGPVCLEVDCRALVSSIQVP